MAIKWKYCPTLLAVVFFMVIVAQDEEDLDDREMTKGKKFQLEINLKQPGLMDRQGEGEGEGEPESICPGCKRIGSFQCHACCIRGDKCQRRECCWGPFEDTCPLCEETHMFPNCKCCKNPPECLKTGKSFCCWGEMMDMGKQGKGGGKGKAKARNAKAGGIGKSGMAGLKQAEGEDGDSGKVCTGCIRPRYGCKKCCQNPKTCDRKYCCDWIPIPKGANGEY